MIRLFRRFAIRRLVPGSSLAAVRCRSLLRPLCFRPRFFSTQPLTVPSSEESIQTENADVDDDSLGPDKKPLYTSPHLIPITTYPSILNAGCWLAARALARKYYDAMLAMRTGSGKISTKEMRTFSKDATFLRPAVQVLKSIVEKRQEVVNLDALILECEKDQSMKELLLEARADRLRVVEALIQLENEMIDHLLPRQEDANRNAILEVRAGTGGSEAMIFCADLFRMYERFAHNQDWKFEIMHVAKSDLGVREACAMVTGDDVFGLLRWESGVHRVQRVPATEKQGRVHTSTATVAIMPEAQDVDVVIDEKDLRIDVYRASGNGGQNVNKTESAVRVTHIPSGIVVAIQDERSQLQNKNRALKILRARLYEQKKAEQEAAQTDLRRQQVGNAERSERIRTYNFAQGRITDHRIGVTKHDIQRMMDGDLLAEFVDELSQQERLKQMQELGLK